MESKTCTKCGETKPLDEYHRHKGMRDGRNPRCKPCRLTYQAESKADYHQANRDAILARKAASRQAHPEAWREARYRSRARGYGFEPLVVSFTMGELYERWGTHCFHCGSEDGTTLDHYPTPVSRGGEHSLDNCRPSCARCQQYSWREDFSPTRDEQD